ncbi:2',3'-cyclic-nucleotide 2'-phosphodiesterase (5'-nucleotidase family) [Alkalibacillus filiformis]|uniref:2',3'-cyclic-nucleotide 2'-phosphodiesterase (5'-nucleotidase family) n=1 Tax=Alkalibacillus filiformis TaxID=200990 RepID=A0ABU0DWL1_9BACI|nr:bifunctional UDP-sugar hydrolase/5'-nucleotidase [Alkalibacillus filiformis]MDQ0352812.1 2',3'-cyclic-nucleotide 2'-phosphodiesterase (5'-nucleotidase family) [Alkalibacillus filiformis]
MKEQIHLYFTSDLHSHFQYWPHIMDSINKKIEQHKVDGEHYLLFDNGDHVDRVHPISEATLGQANVKLLNKANYHAVTLGNNEGITLPKDNLYHLYDDAQFDVVCANLRPSDAPSPFWLKPYEIYTTPNQTKVGVIGLTAPFKKFYEQLDWDVTDPYAKLDQYIPFLRNECDLIVVMSHLGMYDEEAIAEKYPVDVIFGGHTHHLYEEAKKVNGTLINAVGKQGRFFGYVNLVIDHNDAKLSATGEALPIPATVDAETVTYLNELETYANDQLNQVVTNLEHPYEISWFEESEIMSEFVKTLKDWTGADAAALNSGVLLQGFNVGAVTKKHVHESCPHPMNPCKMVLTGEELVETIKLFESERFTNFKLKGLGFRGQVIGKMIYSNITFDHNYYSNKIQKVYLNGEIVNPNKSYTLATADTFSFPWLIPPISKVNEKKYYMPEFLRDVLEECLSKS